jgi:TIR domain
MSTTQRRIFLSHSHMDNEFGTRLAQDLRYALKDENAVWYDVLGGLHGGENWWEKIVEEITSRDVFIVVLSPDAVQSPWVRDEINLAWKQKNSLRGKLIIPLLYRACRVREDLDTLQVISFLSPSGSWPLLARRRADAHLPPRIYFDGLERHDNTRLTRTIPGTEIDSTVFGTQFPGKRIIRIRHDLRPRSDLQRAVRIGPVEDKECAFWMRLEIFHLLAAAVERQLDCTVLVEQKPDRCNLWISILPNRGQYGNIRFEEILVRFRKSFHMCTPAPTNTNRFSIKYNTRRCHSSNNLSTIRIF